MAIAALDLGRRRIGVAIAEGRQSAAYPIGTIERRALRSDFEAIRSLLTDRNVDLIVVGLPLNLDGTEGSQAQNARSFGHQLAEALSLPVAFYDERLSSFEAEERLKGPYQEAPRKRSRRKKGSVDAVAATVILEGWLQAARTPL
jgi:putative Holliday junction resolvase